MALIDALDDWQDGILAIGTFGLDHFLLSEAEYLVLEQQVSVTKGETGEEEAERLAIKAVMKEPDKAFVTNNESDEKAKEVMMEESSGSVASVIGADAVPDDPVRQFVPMEEISSEDTDKEKMKKKGERTTLADLFSADAAAGKCNAEDEKIPTVFVKNQSERRTKHVRSLAKKLVPWKGEDSRPTAKLHRVRLFLSLSLSLSHTHTHTKRDNWSHYIVVTIIYLTTPTSTSYSVACGHATEDSFPVHSQS